MTNIEIAEAAAREQSRVSKMTVGEYLKEVPQPHRRIIAVEIAAACMGIVLARDNPVTTGDYLPPLPKQTEVQQRLDAERMAK